MAEQLIIPGTTPSLDTSVDGCTARKGGIETGAASNVDTDASPHMTMPQQRSMDLSHRYAQRHQSGGRLVNGGATTGMGKNLSPRFQHLHDSLTQGSENHIVTKAFMNKFPPPNLKRLKRQLVGHPSQANGARDPLLEPSGHMTANLSV